MAIFCGIDPGKSGCLCVLDNNIPTFFDWPKDGNIIIFFEEIITHLENNCTENIVLAVLEKVHAMPKQGVTSMFNFGENLGMWKAFLAIHKIPHIIIPPQQWMKGYRDWETDRKSTRLNSSHSAKSRMPSSA